MGFFFFWLTYPFEPWQPADPEPICAFPSAAGPTFALRATADKPVTPGAIPGKPFHCATRRFDNLVGWLYNRFAALAVDII